MIYENLNPVMPRRHTVKNCICRPQTKIMLSSVMNKMFYMYRIHSGNLTADKINRNVLFGCNKRILLTLTGVTQRVGPNLASVRELLVRRHINYITDVTRPVGPDLASGRARVGSRTDNSRPDARSGPTKPAGCVILVSKKYMYILRKSQLQNEEI
jgi:hypothetical protein